MKISNRKMGGNEMRRIREALGLTQEAFGSKVDKHAVSISRYENGAETISHNLATHVRMLAETEAK